MPRRLGPTPASPTPAPPPQTQYVAVRTKGLTIINALGGASLDAITAIETPEGYLQMDAKLAQIRNAKAQWALALEPIGGPLSRAIEYAKKTLSEAKKAAEGVTQLDKEIVGRLDAMEDRCKFLMADFKRNEARRLREAEEATRQEAARLEEEARKRAIQAASTKSPQLRARLEQQRAELEAQAREVEEKVDTLVEPVKGASSAARTIQKVRVTDLVAFFHAITDYAPVNGVYQMRKPPLRTVDKKGLEALLADVVQARLTDLFKEQPGVVASWPGVEVYDDISIAHR